MDLKKLYENPLRRKPSRFFLDSSTADAHFQFVLNADIREIPVHKIILADESEVFYSMFYGGIKETNSILIVDATYDAFLEFVQFFYLSKVGLTLENIADVMYLINKYVVPQFFDLCENFLIENLPLYKIWFAIDLAVLYNRKELKESCMQKVCGNMFDVFFYIQSMLKRSAKGDIEKRVSMFTDGSF